MRDPLAKRGLWAWLTAPKEKPLGRVSPPRTGRWRARWQAHGDQFETAWYVLIALAAAFVLFSAVVSAAAVSPVFCSACHWQARSGLGESVHAGTRCDSCHMAPGVAGLISQRARVVSMVVSAPVSLVTGGGTSGVPSTDNDRCLECHASLLNESVTVNGVIMNHRAPEEAQWLCVQCHLGTAHPTDRYAGGSYSMDMCLKCHSTQATNLSTCDICHPSDQDVTATHVTPWRVVHGANWRSAHGMGDLETCKACHSPGYCVACHNMDLPHPGNYLATHGPEVVARQTGDADCVVCHKGTACDNCHGIEMPHPDTFTKEHVERVEANGTATCERCHDQKACDACHEAHVHPGVAEDLMDELRKRPVTQP